MEPLSTDLCALADHAGELAEGPLALREVAGLVGEWRPLAEQAVQRLLEHKLAMDIGFGEGDTQAIDGLWLLVDFAVRALDPQARLASCFCSLDDCAGSHSPYAVTARTQLAFLADASRTLGCLVEVSQSQSGAASRSEILCELDASMVSLARWYGIVELGVDPGIRMDDYLPDHRDERRAPAERLRVDRLLCLHALDVWLFGDLLLRTEWQDAIVAEEIARLQRIDCPHPALTARGRFLALVMSDYIGGVRSRLLMGEAPSGGQGGGDYGEPSGGRTDRESAREASDKAVLITSPLEVFRRLVTLLCPVRYDPEDPLQGSSLVHRAATHGFPRPSTDGLVEVWTSRSFPHTPGTAGRLPSDGLLDVTATFRLAGTDPFCVERLWLQAHAELCRLDFSGAFLRPYLRSAHPYEAAVLSERQPCRMERLIDYAEVCRWTGLEGWAHGLAREAHSKKRDCETVTLEAIGKSDVPLPPTCVDWRDFLIWCAIGYPCSRYQH